MNWDLELTYRDIKQQKEEVYYCECPNDYRDLINTDALWRQIRDKFVYYISEYGNDHMIYGLVEYNDILYAACFKCIQTSRGKSVLFFFNKKNQPYLVTRKQVNNISNFHCGGKKLPYFASLNTGKYFNISMTLNSLKDFDIDGSVGFLSSSNVCHHWCQPKKINIMLYSEQSAQIADVFIQPYAHDPILVKLVTLLLKLTQVLTKNSPKQDEVYMAYHALLSGLMTKQSITKQDFLDDLYCIERDILSELNMPLADFIEKESSNLSPTDFFKLYQDIVGQFVAWVLSFSKSPAKNDDAIVSDLSDLMLVSFIQPNSHE